jgi:hypothetical protein
VCTDYRDKWTYELISIGFFPVHYLPPIIEDNMKMPPFAAYTRPRVLELSATDRTSIVAIKLL